MREPRRRVPNNSAVSWFRLIGRRALRNWRIWQSEGLRILAASSGSGFAELPEVIRPKPEASAWQGHRILPRTRAEGSVLEHGSLTFDTGVIRRCRGYCIGRMLFIERLGLVAWSCSTAPPRLVSNCVT